MTGLVGLAVVVYYFYYLLFNWGGRGGQSAIQVDVAALNPGMQMTAPADAMNFGGMGATNTPFMPATPTAEPSPIAALEPTATPLIEVPAVLPMPTAVFKPYISPADFCFNCTVYEVPVRFTSYRPWEGGINCFDFRNGYCESAMSSELRWENFVGIGAACPPEWPLGTWVEAPGIGAWACLDRGGMVLCVEHVCIVDVLAESIGDLDGQTITATVYITWK